MRLRLSILAAASFLLSACGPGGPASPPGLAYGLPNPAMLTYVTGDTANMDIDAGGQSMQARVTSSATYGATFARAADGVQVSLEIQDFDARMSNPAGPPASADEGEISGPLVFTLDRMGNVAVVSEPQLEGTAAQFFQPSGVAHSLFPGLPGRAAGAGESWVDTVRYEGETPEADVSVVSIITYTVVGDTVVGDRSLVRIDFEGTSEQAMTGSMAGMDMAQNLTGDATGWVLWDMQRGLMVESYTESDGRGSMEVSAAPFPLGIRVRQQSRVKLQEGM